jgi:hypothetical protein
MFLRVIARTLRLVSIAASHPQQPQSCASATTFGICRCCDAPVIIPIVLMCCPLRLQAVPPVHTTLGATMSVIHYHVKLTINTPSGTVNWFKQYEDAGSKDIWPIAATNQVTDLFATKMHAARQALPPTGHDWKGLGLRLHAARLRCGSHALHRVLHSGTIKWSSALT